MRFLDDTTEEDEVKYTVTKPALSEEIPTTITGWENDPRVQQEAEIYLYELSKLDNTFDPGSYFDDNKDIAEVLRDEDYRIGTILSRAGNVGNLTERGKKAYRFLRSTWDNAEVSNSRERWDATKDIATDLIADPLSLAGLIFTGGTGNAVAQTAGKEGLKQTLRRMAVSESTKDTAIRGAVVGGGGAGLHEDQIQRVELDTNISDSYSLARTGAMVGFGAGAGAGLAGAFSATGKYYAKRAKQRAEAEELESTREIPQTKNKEVDDAVEVLVPSDSTDLSVDVTPGRASIVIDAEDVEVMADNVSRNFGGGEATRAEVLDATRQAVRDSQGKSPMNARSRIKFEVNRVVNKIGSRIVFKPVSLIKPYAKFSNTAKELQKKFRYDTDRSFWGERDYDDQDFYEVYKETAGRYYVRSKVAMEPFAVNMKGKMGDLANDQIIRALRGAEPATDGVETVSKELRSILDEIGTRLEEDGYVDALAENYVPRMWNRSAIEKNRSVFEEKLVQAEEAADLTEASRIVDEMLDKRNQLDGGSSGGSSFFLGLNFKRKFDKLNDNDFEDFLNNDIVDLMNSYVFQSSKQLAKKQVFGVRNLDEYRDAYVNPIIQEMRDAGKTLSKSDRNDLELVWKRATGEGVDRYENTYVKGFTDLYGVANRLAYLPLATLSSVTEVFINVAKAGTIRSLKGFVEASDNAQKTIQGNLKETLGKQGLTEPEIWKEMNKFGLALDISVSDVADRLAGTELSSDLARKMNNSFFRLNFLDQWTKTVQMASYVTGKGLIKDNLKEIAKNQGLPDSARITRLKDELKELNVNIEDGVEWLNNGAKADDAFNETVQRGAARYTNEVILNPGAESSLKPTLMSNPQTSILFQFMSYPAAFTNTVLKNAAKGLIRDPKGNAVKTGMAALVMTETARWTNYARSGGESERLKDREEIYWDAVARWGGNGLIADMMQRGRKAAEIYQDPLAYPVGMTGPVGQDIYTLIKQGDIISFAGKKLPGYGLGRTVERVIDEEFMDEYEKYLRDTNKAFKEAVVPERAPPRPTFAKGGEVLNVPRVPEEPDERIDKMTGLPYNQQAGTAFIDEEDPLRRMGFFGGGAAKVIGKSVKEVLEEYVPSFAKRDKIDEAAETLEMEGVGFDEEDLVRVRASLERTSFADPDADEDIDIVIEETLDKYGLRERPEQSYADTMGQYRAVEEAKIEGRELEEAEPMAESMMVSQELKAVQEDSAPESVETSRILNKLLLRMPAVSEPKVPQEVAENLPERLNEFIKDSTIKEPVYRATGHGIDADFEVNFALPREIGTHFGTKGQADSLAMRDYIGYEDDYLDSRGLTADDMFAGTSTVPGNILAVTKGYLNIKNPLKIEEDFGTWSAQEIFDEPVKRNELVGAIAKQTGKPVKDVEERFFGVMSTAFKKYKDVINNTSLKGQEMQIKIRESDLNARLRDFLKSQGFDGVQYKNTIEDRLAGDFSYIAFDPQQYKIVTASQFDPNDPRVYKAEGGYA